MDIEGLQRSRLRSARLTKDFPHRPNSQVRSQTASKKYRMQRKYPWIARTYSTQSVQGCRVELRDLPDLQWVSPGTLATSHFIDTPPSHQNLVAKAGEISGRMMVRKQRRHRPVEWKQYEVAQEHFGCDRHPISCMSIENDCGHEQDVRDEPY